MNKIYRQFWFSLLTLSLAIAPVHAQDEAGETLSDPALEAIQALEATESPTESPVPEAIQALETAEPSTESQPDAATIETTTEEPVTTPAIETIETAPESIPAPDAPLAKDVVLVLDNSGSMKKNDPQFLGKQAAVKFVEGLDEETRIAVIIFDQAIRMAAPLTEINDTNRVTVLQSLDQIDYKGQWTESPAAIERAIYELKTNGRKEAKKFIVFMTDGVVDTGDPAKDLEQARWLKGELAEDAANSDIKIFGIAYTENADFHLIQSIAQKTSGEYFRALKPEDLQSVFEQVDTIVNKVPEPEIITPPPPVVTTPEPVVAAPPPPPVIIEVPVESKGMDKEEKLRSMMILVALSVLIIAVIIMVLMLLRGSRKKADTDEYAQEAYLNDINMHTSQASYKLGNVPTMLGRVAGTDTEHLNYIVIPQTTIGRRHALIEYKDFAYWIIDQGSINGTFVNDQIITSETRLKHGDKVRLHKFEFEFVMPEMVEAGMTMISKTVMAANPVARGEEETIARGNHVDADLGNLPEPDFDLTGGHAPEGNPDEEDTIIKGSTPGGHRKEERDDETLMMDNNDALDSGDEDATIRPDMDNDDDDDSDLTVDSFHDIDKKK